MITLSALAREHPAGANQDAEALKVTTHLVQVNVIVKDRHGQLVGGLKSGDFTILDEGEPQKISIFRIEQTQPTVALPPVPPDIFTNVPERQAGTSPAVTVILLDGLNTRWEHQARSAEQVIKFLKQLQPGDRVGLYALGTRLIMLHDFSSDSAALVEALNHFQGRANTEVEASQADSTDHPPEWTDEASQLSSDIPSAAVTGAIQNWLANATSNEARYYMNQRVEMTVAALVAIADHLRGVPGRKNLIWVSSAFPLLRGIDQLEQSGDFSNGSTYEEQLSRAAEALNEVNLAIYPVDARGLMGDPNFAVQTGAPNPAAYRRMRTAGLPSHLTENFPTMDEFAKRTGGRAFYNTNDIQGSIRHVIDDSSLTYLLGYYPSETVWNGKYHKIQLKVDRPGLRLQYRSGYAAEVEPPAAVPSAQAALDAAVLSPLDATGVALAVKTTPEKTVAGAPPNIVVQYWINPRDITLNPEGKKWAVSVTMVVEEFGPQRQTLQGTSHRFNFDVTDDQRKQFLTAGLRYNEQLTIVPHAERLRVVVRDDPTGTLGSVNVPLSRILAQHAN